MIYPLKNVKKNAILFKLFWYKVFVHWKLKLLNFLVDSALNFKNLAITTFSPKLVVDRTTATMFSRQNDVGLCARTT